MGAGVLFRLNCVGKAEAGVALIFACKGLGLSVGLYLCAAELREYGREG